MPFITLLISWFVFSLILIQKPFANVNEKLNLQNVLDSTKQNFPGTNIAELERQQSELQIQSTQGAFDPVLKSSVFRNWSDQYPHSFLEMKVEQPTTLYGAKLYGAYRNSDGLFAPYDEKYKTGTSGEVSTGIEVPLLKGGWTDERRLRIKNAELGFKGTEALTRAQILEILQQAGIRYWDWVGSGRKLIIAKEMLEIAVKRDKAIQYRVDHGDAAKIDLVENQRMVAFREAFEKSALIDFQKASIQLSFYFRNSDRNPILPTEQQVPSETHDEPPLAIIENSNQESTVMHPLVLSQQFKLSQSMQEESLAKNNLLPSLNADFSLAKDYGQTSSLTRSTELRFQLKFEMPLFLRTDRAKLSTARISVQRAEDHLRLTTDRIRNNQNEINQSLNLLRSRLEINKKELELAQKMEIAEKARFEQGDSNLFMLNAREQTTAEAKLKIIETKIEIQKTLVSKKALDGSLYNE